MTTLRPASHDDVRALVELVNAEAQALYGRPEATETEIAAWFSNPMFDVERDTVVAEEDGLLVAYADVGDHAKDGTRLWIDVRHRPGHEPAAGAVLEAAERKARERAAPGGLLRTVVADRADALRRLVEASGYRLARSSFRMRADFEGPPAEPAFPAGVRSRLAEPGEERALYEAAEECFQDAWDYTRTPYEEWLHWMTSGDNDPTLWFVADAAGEVAGVCLCRPNAHGDETTGWVATLGVRRPWRRQGLGTALLLHAFREFHRRGLTGAALGVDTESPTGAVGLYERAGMRVERRTDVYERPADG